MNKELFAEARAVLAALAGTDVSEIEIVQNDKRIYLRRFEVIENEPAAAPVLSAAPAAGSEQPAAAPAGKLPADQTPNVPVVPARPTTLVDITTPLTGIYYGSPSPNAKQFVTVGDYVEASQTVCLVEAMKVFNAISSGVSGKVVKIVAKSGELVKAGQVLMEIDTAGTPG